MIRTYSELMSFDTFLERFEYLQLHAGVGVATFGSARYLNQMFYHDPAWRSVRDQVIIRDSGCDLGIEGRDIHSRIHIHHLNPISKDQVLARDPVVFDLNNLVCCSEQTHRGIHYGSTDVVVKDPTVRYRGDTKLW